MKRLVASLSLLALALPAPALAKGEFHPEEEFELHEWVPIHIGPLDLSINKAVVYLLLGSLCTILLAWFLMRFRLSTEPDRRQTVGEWVYDIAQNQVAAQGLPTKGMRTWFPYVFALMLFIWTVNMLGFVPLPLTGETWHGIPVWGIYAATSQLSVTLALALLTFVFTHVEGIRYNGPTRYFKSWIPDVPKGLYPLIVPLEILGQFMRLISLSVRLFANMLAGHITLKVFAGFVASLGTMGALGIGGAVLPLIMTVALTGLEFLVAFLQAYVFAVLTCMYLNDAIHPGGH